MWAGISDIVKTWVSAPTVVPAAENVPLGALLTITVPVLNGTQVPNPNFVPGLVASVLFEYIVPTGINISPTALTRVLTPVELLSAHKSPSRGVLGAVALSVNFLVVVLPILPSSAVWVSVEIGFEVSEVLSTFGRPTFALVVFVFL